MNNWDEFKKSITFLSDQQKEEIERIAQLEAKHGTTFYLQALDHGDSLTYEEIVELIRRNG